MNHLRTILPAAVAFVALVAFPGTGRTQTTEGTHSGALAGYTTGSPLDIRPLVPVTAYSSSTWVSGIYGSIAPPIFFTSRHFPGIYGAYDIGVAPLMMNREPTSYPTIDPREVIPAATTTVPALRTASTPAGAATMTTAPPWVTPAVPGSAALRTTYAPQTPAVPAAFESDGLSARLVVRMPEDARLVIDDTDVAGTGEVRKFTTPPLVPGKMYHYDVRATWIDGGRQVVRERHIQFQGGDRVDIDFLAAAAPETERALKVRPGAVVPTTPPLNPTMPPRRP
jgi:uncharacterized protein (TIGR03000 family)